MESNILGSRWNNFEIPHIQNMRNSILILNLITKILRYSYIIIPNLKE